MAERILKREQTREGDEYLVASRQVVSAEAVAGEAPASVEGAPEQTAGEGGAVDQLLAAAQQQAEHITGRVEAEVEQKRMQADDELRQLREAAAAELAQKRRTHESEIRREVENQYRERYSAAVTALEEAARELRERQTEYVAQIEQPALKLVLAIARQLLGDELSRAPEFIAGLIARAFDLLKPQQVVSVALDPETHRRLLTDDLLVDALRKAGIKPELAEITADSELVPGQFTAEVNGMSVEYDLNEIIRELTAQIEQRAASLADGNGKEGS